MSSPSTAKRRNEVVRLPHAPKVHLRMRIGSNVIVTACSSVPPDHWLCTSDFAKVNCPDCRLAAWNNEANYDR